MAFEQELDVYLRARFTLMVLVTTEEERALQTVKSVCEKSKRPCLTWDVADGFQSLAGGAAAPTAKDPISALEQIDKADSEALYVLKDFHDCWGNAQFKRKLRSVAHRLKFTKKSILVTTPSSKIPEELKDEAVVVEFAPPNTAELEAVLNRLTQTPGVKVNLTKLGREKLVQAALGLTASQAQRVFAKAIVSNGALDDRDIDLVTQEKKEIIRESEALEFYAVTETPDDVGGLGVLKNWLRLRERAFTQEARDYGLPSPKGIALIGIPGTGKSLTAKMIGGLWRLPLLRLDVGALFGSLVGEAEERTRRALRLAETVAPCVAGNTRVTLVDGSEQTIESLYQQSPECLTVLGMNEQFQLQPVDVHAITCRPAPDLYHVQLVHASLRATSNHSHPVLRDGRLIWVCTDALTENDHVAIEQIGSSHPAKRLRMEAWQRQIQVESKDRTDVIPVGARLRAVRQQLRMGSHHFQNTRSSLIGAYERNKIHPSRRRLCSILCEMKAWAKLHQISADPLDEIQLLVDATVMWSRVLSVKSEAPAEPVYDLVCEEPHTFIANGIITHNCIVWIDEMEKALAHGGGDSGASTRVFGTILTWMQEKTAPCFVIGTANDISSLPPEVLRKGRFDEIFFLDLPTMEERREIFTVHLRKRNRLPQDFDTSRLARESQGYVGAEIEQAVIDAMYVGFNAQREFTTEDISAALKRQVPLSVSQRETIEALRNWLREGRAQSGSFQELQEAEQQFVPLQIEAPN